ncbi:unnamed protein product [Mycena citricolor]|uniref:Uncharacterized protein n=1 Tax=Mycena citricolor TaxID=2018698 RepID=A0AAD2H657_9AGAR|nr:unnamed protein product [Mycena citricolor]
MPPEIPQALELDHQRPRATTVLRILSNDSYSVLQNGSYAIVGTIDWRGRFPRVELPNTLPSVEARRWLSLSPDLSRSMTFQGRKYRWVPEGEHVNVIPFSPFATQC